MPWCVPTDVLGEVGGKAHSDVTLAAIQASKQQTGRAHLKQGNALGGDVVKGNAGCCCGRPAATTTAELVQLQCIRVAGAGVAEDQLAVVCAQANVGALVGIGVSLGAPAIAIIGSGAGGQIDLITGIA